MSWVRVDDGFEDHPKVEPLSDAAHRLWLRAACWCKKPTNEHTLGFVPRAMLRTIARNKFTQAKLEKLAEELVNATAGGIFDQGLWEPVDGGWRFHDWATYQPKDDEERIKERRSEAGRKGAEARWGHANRNGTAFGKRDDTAHGTASFANGKPMAKNAPEPAPTPDPQPGPKQAGTHPASQPPSRPIVRAGLLPEKISARDWQIPDDHRVYATALGLSSLQIADAIADFREKTQRTGQAAWLSSILCRFFEARAERISQKRDTDPVEQRESGVTLAAAPVPFAETSAGRALREAFPEDYRA